MSALSRAQEHLRAARRELEGADSEVPAYAVDSLRFLRAEVQTIRQRVENVRKACGDFDPDAES